MSTSLVQRAYDWVTWAVQPLVRRKLRRRGQAEPGYLLDVPERFGRYESAPGGATGGGGKPAIWMHAVSLGETQVAGILLEALREQWPGMRLILTHGTATGREAGHALLHEGDVQVWQPWDTPGATLAFIRHHEPDFGILIETEVWPNLVRSCRQANVPLFMVNARLSPQTLRKTRRLMSLMGPAYADLSAVWAQSEADAQRLRSVGAPVRGAFNNLKFDARPDPAQIELGMRWREALSGVPVVMLASSREGEEALFLQEIRRQAGAPSAGAVQWLLVPRHPQRFDDIAQLAQSQGLKISRRRDWDGVPGRTDLWLGDSMGEMTAYYTAADVVLLGGSFEPHGGQNLIEAAACGCPVIMGPYTYNFATVAAQAIRFGAGAAVDSMRDAVLASQELLASRVRHAQMVEAAGNFARSYRGTARHTVQAIAECLQA